MALSKERVPICMLCHLVLYLANRNWVESKIRSIKQMRAMQSWLHLDFSHHNRDAVPWMPEASYSQNWDQSQSSERQKCWMYNEMWKQWKRFCVCVLEVLTKKMVPIGKGTAWAQGCFFNMAWLDQLVQFSQQWLHQQRDRDWVFSFIAINDEWQEL